MSAPGFASSVMSVARLHTLRMLRGHKLLWASLAVVAVVVASLANSSDVPTTSPGAAPGVSPLGDVFTTGFFHMLVYVVPFLLHGGAISEEVETRTLPFLLMRPTGRTALVLGKFAAASLAVFALLAIAVVLVHVGHNATSPTGMLGDAGSSARVLGALLLLSLSYGAFAMFWGIVVPEASAILTIVQFGTVEFVLAQMPFATRLLSMNHWALALAGLPPGGWLPDTVPVFETWVAGTVLAVVPCAMVGIAATVFRNSEVGFGRA